MRKEKNSRLDYMLHNITFEDTSIVSQANWKNN